MDNNYLDKVIDQIVRETRIDRDERKIYTPFSYIHRGVMELSIWNYSHLDLDFPPHYFSHHCKEVYWLNEDEIDYVLTNYQRIIRDKRDG